MSNIRKVQIKEDYINLGQFLKIVDLVSSGGETKSFLSLNKIFINKVEDNRRGRKLYKGDLIEVNSQVYEIC